MILWIIQTSNYKLFKIALKKLFEMVDRWLFYMLKYLKNSEFSENIQFDFIFVLLILNNFIKPSRETKKVKLNELLYYHEQYILFFMFTCLSIIKNIRFQQIESITTISNLICMLYKFIFQYHRISPNFQINLGFCLLWNSSVCRSNILEKFYKLKKNLSTIGLYFDNC